MLTSDLTIMTVTPEILMADKNIRDMLWPFDFAVVDNSEYGPVWFDTALALFFGRYKSR